MRGGPDSVKVKDDERSSVREGEDEGRAVRKGVIVVEGVIVAKDVIVVEGMNYLQQTDAWTYHDTIKDTHMHVQCTCIHVHCTANNIFWIVRLF